MKKFALTVAFQFVLVALLAAGFFAAQAQDEDWRTLVPVGALQLYAGDPASAPTGWLVADGSCVSTVTYAELYAVIGDTFNVCAGPPEEDPLFALPDMRGRVPVGAGWGDTLSPRTLGDVFGEETHLLTVDELPSHTHDVTDPGHTHTIPRSGGGGGLSANFAAGTVPGSGNTSSSTTGISIDFTGGDEPFDISQPSLAVNYLIWSGVEALDFPAVDIDITVVVVFPSHTPTPTPTETLTPTPGPSPTDTPTATPTGQSIYESGVMVAGRDVLMRYEVTPVDLTLITFMAIFLVLAIGAFVLHLRRRR